MSLIAGGLAMLVRGPCGATQESFSLSSGNLYPLEILPLVREAVFRSGGQSWQRERRHISFVKNLQVEEMARASRFSGY